MLAGFILRGDLMENIYKLYLIIALSFLVLSLIALPYLKPGSPSFIVNLLGMMLLLLFIIMLLILTRRFKMLSLR